MRSLRTTRVGLAALAAGAGLALSLTLAGSSPADAATCASATADVNNAATVEQGTAAKLATAQTKLAADQAK